MEEPLPSKFASAVGSDDGEKGLCDGFRVDGQWEHHRVHQGAYTGDKSLFTDQVNAKKTVSKWIIYSTKNPTGFFQVNI